MVDSRFIFANGFQFSICSALVTFRSQSNKLLWKAKKSKCRSNCFNFPFPFTFCSYFGFSHLLWIYFFFDEPTTRRYPFFAIFVALIIHSFWMQFDDLSIFYIIRHLTRKKMRLQKSEICVRTCNIIHITYLMLTYLLSVMKND